MEKLALLIPPLPPGTQAQGGRSTAALLAQALVDGFQCSCIRPDPGTAFSRPGRTDAPSYTQRSYDQWHQAGPAAAGRFDAALALDGLHPWALAALERLDAQRRFCWLCDLPEDYLLPEDVPFFAERYAAMTGVFCANAAIGEQFCHLFPALAERSMVIAPPLDMAYYRELAQNPCDLAWESDTADMLAVCRLDSESEAEQIPALAAAWQQRRPALRWHIAGAGERRDRLVQAIVLHDVCETVELLDVPENLAPLMAQANAYLAVDEAGDAEAERMARAMGKPVLHWPVTEEQLLGIEVCAGKAAFPGWADREKLMSALKEERK